VDGHVQDLAERFATAGYVALAPDLYSAGGGRPDVLSAERVEEAKAFLDGLPPGQVPVAGHGVARRWRHCIWRRSLRDLETVASSFVADDAPCHACGAVAPADQRGHSELLRRRRRDGLPWELWPAFRLHNPPTKLYWLGGCSARANARLWVSYT
jgi:hypothetical protein